MFCPASCVRSFQPLSTLCGRHGVRTRKTVLPVLADQQSACSPTSLTFPLHCSRRPGESNSHAVLPAGCFRSSCRRQSAGASLDTARGENEVRTRTRTKSANCVPGSGRRHQSAGLSICTACPSPDLNRDVLSDTATSRLRVCRFARRARHRAPLRGVCSD